jgi:hypothetical protein
MRRPDTLELAEHGGGLGRVVTAPRNRVDDMPLAGYNVLVCGKMPLGLSQTAQQHGAIHRMTLARHEPRRCQQRPQACWGGGIVQAIRMSAPARSEAEVLPRLAELKHNLAELKVKRGSLRSVPGSPNEEVANDVPPRVDAPRPEGRESVGHVDGGEDSFAQ